MDKKEIIFALFKDKALDIDIFKDIVKKRYKIDDYYKIYLKIINYQIDKYGIQLNYYLDKRVGIR